METGGVGVWHEPFYADGYGAPASRGFAAIYSVIFHESYGQLTASS